jgi:non-homologous end joining protein Ku
MDTSDSGLDEPGDEQQTKRLELGTLPEDEIDELYLNNPYYIAPDGEVGQQALAKAKKDTSQRLV